MSSKKRSLSESLDDDTPIVHPKKRSKPSKKSKSAETSTDSWPSYFHNLFRVYKALNTVLAFVTSRKQLATTFPTVRSSVENIIKEPLDLAKVAELKALLPDIIRFAYVPESSLRINDPFKPATKSTEADFSIRSEHTSSEDEHVLILEFSETWGGGQTETNGLAPTRTPAATKKLVERRNERYIKAINELLQATSLTEDPVLMLQSAARDHIPVNPTSTLDNEAEMFEDPINIPVPDPEHRLSVSEILQEIQKQPWYKDQIIERRSVEERAGQIVKMDLSENIRQALMQSRGISSLYSHQASSIRALSEGRHVIVSTSTASGKTVIYQIPLLKFLEENASSTAIFVYPTKALAQDQRASLETLLAACPGLEHIKVATYDGDTQQELRAGIRETASIIFTNFDMIHASILPHEELWRRFLKSLKLFVVDELHYYTGAMGSHVALIMRRFRRLCAALGNRRACFVSCSATIANPQQAMETLLGIPAAQIEAVTEDGAPSGSKEYMIWSPPYVDELDHGMGKVNTIREATGLMRFLMKRGIRVILFCKHRKVCELAMKTLRTELSSDGRHDILERVYAYRGGYGAEDRRKIEYEAFTGHLLGLVATNALELGVDIGTLDAVIMLGFPITLASFRQQAGRAGRRKRDSLVVFLAQNLPLDQYYVQNPLELFDGVPSDVVVDIDNEDILEAHLQCAAHEIPMALEDEQYFGPLMPEICHKKLVKDKDGWFHTHPRCLPSPSKLISIRGVKEEKYVLIDDTTSSRKILEEIEISRALFEIYEGGVFLHQGKPYIVKEINHDSKLARLVQTDVNWTTKPRDFTDINALQTYRIREIRKSPERAYYGRIEISCHVFGFIKIRDTTIVDVVDVESEPWVHQTTGFWIDVPNHALPLLREKLIKPAAAIHSASHAILNQFALSLDLRTECKAEEKEYLKKESSRKRPARLVIYDAVGHTGVAAKAFDNVSDFLRKALNAVENCPCEEGCSKCTLSSTCKEGNKVNSKAGGLTVLKAILGVPIDPASIPFETNQRALGGHDSIVAASPVHTRTNLCIETIE